MQTMFGHILLKQRTGEVNDTRDGSNILFQTYVLRGELVSQIPIKDRIPRKDGSPSHNYCLHNDPATTLYDDGTGVCPLQGAELDYLKAIYNQTTRILQYLEPNKMKWIMNVSCNDNVFFRLKLAKRAPPVAVKGKIRYYGHVQGCVGVMFGLEVLVSCSYNFNKGGIARPQHFNVCYIVIITRGVLISSSMWELSFTIMGYSKSNHIALSHHHYRILSIRVKVILMVVHTFIVETIMQCMWLWTRL